MVLSQRIAQINSLTQDECWYITRQTLNFKELCFAAKILEEYKTNSTGLNFENYFINKATEYSLSSTVHRQTNNCYYIGLLKKNGTQYKDAELTPIYFEIKSRCNGDFNNTALYQDIIISQIEKVFISNPSADEESSGLRNNYKIHPAYFLAKVLLGLGDITGEHTISLNEYYRFVGTSYNFSYYFSTIELILEAKNGNTELQNIQIDKFSGNRVHLLLSNLPYFEVSSGSISFKKEYIREMKSKLVEYECNLQDDYFTLDFLNSIRTLTKQAEKEVGTERRTNVEGQVPFNPSTFYHKTLEAQLKFKENLIIRFIASLCAKPFVICSGLSGSGKTKLAQSFVQWICEDKDQYAIIPVGADWTNREPLLGYPNGLEPKSYITPDSGALNLIIDALKEENSNKPYFLILDEMNLSHVERYFADFLSIMESGDEIQLYSGNNRYNPYTSVDDEINENLIPQKISWPKNLFIIGTVNIDETTYMFSPKVLDRANVIEFRISDTDMKDFLADENRKPIDLKKLNNKGANMAKSFLDLAADKSIKKIQESKVLNDFFNQLQEVGSEFGYRSATEIELLITKLGVIENTSLSDSDKIDIGIMQKLLPKLHGSRKKLIGPLEILAGFCVKDVTDLKKEVFEAYDKLQPSKKKYPISLEKIVRMHKNAINNGFTSYAEA